MYEREFHSRVRPYLLINLFYKLVDIKIRLKSLPRNYVHFSYFNHLFIAICH